MCLCVRPIAHILIRTLWSVSTITRSLSFSPWLEYFLILLCVTECSIFFPFNTLLHFYSMCYAEEKEREKKPCTYKSIKGRINGRKATRQEYKYHKHSHNYIWKRRRFSIWCEMFDTRVASLYIRYDSAYWRIWVVWALSIWICLIFYFVVFFFFSLLLLLLCPMSIILDLILFHRSFWITAANQAQFFCRVHSSRWRLGQIQSYFCRFCRFCRRYWCVCVCNFQSFAVIVFIHRYQLSSFALFHF